MSLQRQGICSKCIQIRSKRGRFFILRAIQREPTSQTPTDDTLNFPRLENEEGKKKEPFLQTQPVGRRPLLDSYLLNNVLNVSTLQSLHVIQRHLRNDVVAAHFLALLRVFLQKKYKPCDSNLLFPLFQLGPPTPIQMHRSRSNLAGSNANLDLVPPGPPNTSLLLQQQRRARWGRQRSMDTTYSYQTR